METQAVFADFFQICAISYSNWSTEHLNDKKINNPPHEGLALNQIWKKTTTLQYIFYLTKSA